MTPVQSTTQTAAPQAPTAVAKAQIDYNAFLRLFIASMKNQDPTKPNDPSETLSQLASFSNVEQSIKLNEKLSMLVSSSSASVAASLIGKQISSLDGKVKGVASGFEATPTGLVAVLDNGGRIDLAKGYKVGSA